MKLHVPVELRLETISSPIRVETADLSLSGCYIEMLFTLELGTQLDMTLQLGDSTLLAVRKVVTSDRNVGNGIQFRQMLLEDRDELKRFIEAAEADEQSDAQPPGE
jgi:hypothetical protein